VLRLSGGQVESLFDLGLPVEVRELPADLAALDVLLADPALLVPVQAAWEQTALGHGRPTIPIDRFVRLMVIKQRSGWGYETLVREVSDSLHLRRFCLIALTERAPDESTVRKLVGRLGAEVVEECRAVIAKATSGERRFVARACPMQPRRSCARRLPSASWPVRAHRGSRTARGPSSGVFVA
jgi:IS5 family transposase